MGVPDHDCDTITIKVRDPDRELVKLITHIRMLAGPGHSFVVVVDPSATENEGKRTFSMDGDGSFHIRDIWFNNVHVEKLEGSNLMLKEYLEKIQT